VEHQLRSQQALTTVYARALQRIEIMDRGGYDAVWLINGTEFGSRAMEA
jgi:hypothetical protein